MTDQRLFDAARIRPATPDDAPALAQVNLHTWQATYRNLLSDGYLDALTAQVAERAEVLRDAIARHAYSVWVVEQGGRVVAWASLGLSRDKGTAADSGELRAINLLPEVWAQGLGRRLWETVRDQLQAAGFNTVTVWVIPGNARAVGFYEAVGFVEEPDTATTVIDRGEPLPLVRYRIAL